MMILYTNIIPCTRVVTRHIGELMQKITQLTRIMCKFKNENVPLYIVVCINVEMLHFPNKTILTKSSPTKHTRKEPRLTIARGFVKASLE